MASEKVCMGCMQPVGEQETKFPQCGYPAAGVNPADYLPVHTLLNGRYLVGRVLEIGGDSAVYIGLDTQDNSRVTVREFFPQGLAQREAPGATVVPAAGAADIFGTCRTKFLSLARAVARLRDVLVVVPSYDIFEANGTAYSVSEYCGGISLEKYVEQQGGNLPVEEVRRLFLPLIGALSTIHATGVLHLALSPKNILVDNEGHLRLKNFAIAEVRTASGVGKPSRVPGYAAPEQYEVGAECTAAADVYGLAATMFFALTGNAPAEAAQRQKRGDALMMPADVADSLPPYIQESLHRALRLSAQRRTQTAQQLLDELSTTQAVASLREVEEEPEEKPAGPKYLWLIFVVLVAALAVLAVFVLKGLGYISFGEPAPTTTGSYEQLTMKPTETTAPIDPLATGKALFDVPSLQGKGLQEAKKLTLPGDMKVELQGYEYSEAPKGQIVSQIPAAGSQVERGTVIKVYISAGSNIDKMPDVRGWPEAYAKLYLQALGYHVGESMRLQVSTLERGSVEKTVPAAGSSVKQGDTVTLWVSDVAPSTNAVAEGE